MKGIVIIDTNFLVANTGKIKDIIPKMEENEYIVYVPKIVQEEYINIQLRRIKETYEQLEKIEKNNLYLNMKYNSKDNVLLRNEQGYRNSFSEYFGDKIIAYDEKEMLNEVLKRNRYKEPPFYNEQNSSDKGFKDSIIWIAIKNFIINYKEKTNFYYVTSDNGFIKYKQELEKEILKENLTILEIKDDKKLFEVLKITNQEENDQGDNIFQKDEINIEEIREEINNLMWEFNNCIEEDWNGNSYEQKRYEIYKYINYDNTERFLQNIPNVVKENIFRKSIVIKSFFKFDDEVFSKGEDIDINIVNDIYNLYFKIKGTEYQEPFIKFVMQKINENKAINNTFVSNNNDELPF